MDEILTGGYAYDPSNPPAAADSKTPKRSNVGYTITSPQSPDVVLSQSTSNEDQPINCSTPKCQPEDGVGYVFSHNRKGAPIVEPLLHPPRCEHGPFFYKIVSTTPLPILSGPSSDAPVSKALSVRGPEAIPVSCWLNPFDWAWCR